MNSIVDSIYEGKEADNQLAQKLHEILSKAAGKFDFEKEIGNNVFQRVKKVKGALDWSQVHNLLQNEYQFEKSAELSGALREKGNELYKQRNGEGALRAYTLAIAFAPRSSEQLSIAFANRSAILLQMNRAIEALEDIKRALADKCPSNLGEKLKDRAEKCEAVIKSQEQLETKIPQVDKYFRIEMPNEKVPKAEDFVQIEYSPERGRHLIVSKDVPAGTVLLIDQPFVSVLNKFLTWETEHCHNCSQKMLNGLPCEQCTFTLFCSEACRTTACSGVHRYEHTYLHILRALNFSHGDIQALRILALVGPQQLHKLYKSNNLTSSNPKDEIGYDKDGIYDTKSYLPIFHLISHEQTSMAESSPVINAVKAVFLKELLKRHSKFFRKPLVGEGCEDFTAALILKHVESIKYNAISISKLVTDNKKASQPKSIAYAAAVYPLISLCNHSCDPNCAPVKKSKHLVTSLLALKHLKEGDELFITYKPLYTQLKTSDRQRFLADNYKFICSCQPCENNWSPATVQIASSATTGATLILEPTRCDECSPRQCHPCALKDVGRGKELQKLERDLFECHDLLEDNNYSECLQRLPEIVDYFGARGFFSHFPLYNIALELFKKALVYSVSKL